MAERFTGIDLNEKYAMVSYYAPGMSEPGTFSMVTGSEIYQIPLCVAKQKGVRQWFCGEEARRRAREEGTLCVEGLLKKALSFESVEVEGERYETRELLFVFLRKLLALPLQPGGETQPDRVVITSEHMSRELRQLLGLFVQRQQLPAERLMLMDYRESFYYYALSQPQELCQHEVMLYYYDSRRLLSWRLCRDKRTVPQVAVIEEKSYDPLLERRDEDFCRIVEEMASGHIISAVYLIGDGFDGDWMKRSLAAICRGRRAFKGKNLFSKGACYGAAARERKQDWPYVYLGDDEIRIGVSLKVENGQKTEFVPLISAGDNWHEAGAQCEVILKGSASVDFWFQHPKSRKAAVRTLELTDFPEREDRKTRLRISAQPVSVDEVKLCIRDMGFGELEKSTEKVWEYTMALELPGM